jgi:topoisomerase IA-like protein
MASKYGKKAGEKVEKAMHERKRGTLKSGSSGKKVKSRKQAIAIGLSEARRAGGKVPSKKSSKKATSKKSSKKATTKKSSKKSSKKSTKKSSKKSK